MVEPSSLSCAVHNPDKALCHQAAQADLGMWVEEGHHFRNLLTSPWPWGVSSAAALTSPVHVCVPSHLSCIQLFVTLWTATCQASLSVGFSRQEYWSGLPCPPPGVLSHPGIKPASPLSPTLADIFFTTAPPGRPLRIYLHLLIPFFPC